MVKKAQLITNVMDRLTQAVVVGVWLLCKVVMSNQPINKEKTELNTRKTKPTIKTNPPLLQQTTSKICGRKEQRWKRKVELGRVGRKCIGYWVNGVGEEKNGEEPE